MANYPKVGLIAFLNTAEFTRGLRTYTRGLAELTTGTLATERTLSGGFRSLGDGVLRAAGMTAAALGIVAVAAGGVVAKFVTDAFKASLDFEEAFAGVVKTAGNLTVSYGVLNAAGQELKDTLIEMSTRKPMSFEDLAEIAMVGAQAGLSTDMLADYTNMVADLVSASELTPEAAATGLAQYINIMDLLGEKAGAPIENIESLGATIAALGNAFPGTEQGIITLAQRLAGLGKAVEMDPQDILAIAAAMEAVGVRSEAGGTAGQRVMMGIQEAVAGAYAQTTIDNTEKMADAQEDILQLEQKLAIKKQRLAELAADASQATRMQYELDIANLEAALEEQAGLYDTYAANHGKTSKQMNETAALYARLMGVSVGELVDLWRTDPGEAMRLFIIGISKEGENAAATLKKLGLGDARLIRTFEQLAGKEDLITDAFSVANIAWEEQIALINEAEERYATLPAILDIMKNRFKAFQAGVGDTLKPAFRQIIKMFQSAEAPGKKLIALFEKRIGPALEDVAVGFRLLTMGDTEGMWAAFKSAIIKGFPDSSAEIWKFVTDTRNAIDWLTRFIEDNRDIIIGAIKGISIVLAAAGFTAILRRIGAVLYSLTSPIGLVILAAAALYTAWETNFLGIRDKTLEVIEQITPKVEEWWGQLQEWFNTDLKPKIEAGDWYGIGYELGGFLIEGIRMAISATSGLVQMLFTTLRDALFGREQDLGLHEGAPSDVLKAYQDEAERIGRAKTWYDIGMEIGTALAAGLKGALAGMWDNLETGEKAVAGAVGGFLGTIGTLMGVGGAVNTTKALGQVLKKIGPAIVGGLAKAGGILGPWGVAIAAAIGLIVALAVTWDEFGGPTLAKIVEWFGEKAPEALDKFREAFQERQGREGLLQPLIDELKEFEGIQLPDLSKIFPRIELLPEGITLTRYDRMGLLDPRRYVRPTEELESVEPEDMSFLEQLNYYILAPIESIKTEWNKMLDEISLVKWLGGELATLWTETIQPWLSDLWTFIKESAEESWAAIGTAFAGVLDEWKEDWEEYKTTVSTMWTTAKTDIGEMLDNIGLKVETVVTWITGVWNTLKETAISSWAAIGVAIADAVAEYRRRWEETKALSIKMWNTMETDVLETIANIKADWIEFLEGTKTFLDGIYEQLIQIRKMLEELGIAKVPAAQATSQPPGSYASGTKYYPGGWGLVGENGPEMVKLPRGTQIFPNRMSMPAAIVNNNTYQISVELPAGTPFETQRAASIGVLEALKSAGVA